MVENYPLGCRVLLISLLWSLLRETLIMLLETYALLWKALRETVLLLWFPIMEKKALLRETVLIIIKRTGKRNYLYSPPQKRGKTPPPRFSVIFVRQLHIPTE